ncbi:Peptidase S10, serine carboxypeptidase [Trema orientale]|uniref:Peptidase S10, serine carboxypeptidase n=1 Tax=Trema orientale TaxID=63057 RepID=A0A2P5FRW1_TREOI|nr:Peptidase S10, serine carboxypeptidase [Trema orientale]
MLSLDSPIGVGFSYTANKSFYVNVNDEITGNPLLEFDSDGNSKGDYLWSHGLISDESYDLLTTVCSFSQIMRETLTLKGNTSFSPACTPVAKQVFEEVNYLIDEYDVSGNFCNSTVNQSKTKIYKVLGILDEKAAAQGYEDCSDKTAYNYFNRKDVQKALHVRLVGVVEWRPCSKVLKYDRREVLKPTINILGYLLRSGIRALVYSGDQDSVIPFISTRNLVAGLAKELGLNASKPYRAWFERKQVGGWTKVYGNILAYATIRGASHAAPSTQPARSLLLLKSFLGNTSSRTMRSAA